MIMDSKTKETIIAVILALLGLVFVTAVVGMVLSQGPDIRPLYIYVDNSTGK